VLVSERPEGVRGKGKESSEGRPGNGTKIDLSPDPRVLDGEGFHEEGYPVRDS